MPWVQRARVVTPVLSDGRGVHPENCWHQASKGRPSAHHWVRFPSR